MESKDYKYDRGDGVMVSRQRMYQLRNKDKHNAMKRKYYANNKKAIAEKARVWRDAFEKEHGISYYLWRKKNAEAKTD